MMSQFFSEQHAPAITRQLEEMTLRQKLAQMLHVPAWSNRDETHLADLKELVEKYGIGGITFFQGTPEAQIAVTEQLQALSKVPLMISIDAEWGLAMRLQNSSQLPYAMTLGAADRPDLTHSLAAELGRQCACMGIHVNFAPDTDLNTEPSNPVIGFRSLGPNPERVVAHAQAYAEGLADHGVMPVIKHFPGHGDTHQDSHLTLPILTHELERLKQVELSPFMAMKEKGIPAIMTGHLQVPTLDNRPNRPATLSQPILQQLLKEEMGFEGLVFTDALDMGAVAEHYTPAEAALEAVKAGNDILIFSTDVPGALEKLEIAVSEGIISESQVDASVRKQLAVKHYWANNPAFASLSPPVESSSFSPQLIETYTAALRPYGAQDGLKSQTFELLSLNAELKADALKHHQLTLTGKRDTSEHSPFERALLDAQPDRFSPWNADVSASDATLIISLLGLSPKAGLSYGLTPELMAEITRLAAKRETYIVLFGRDQAWQLLEKEAGNLHGLTAWQDTPESQKAAVTFLLNKLS